MSVQAVPRAPQVHATGGISSRVATGALWSMLGFAFSRLLSFLTNLFLARLLSPADFGIVSFAMIMIGACTLLQDLGVPAAIVYGRREPRVVGGTALTINVAVAVVLFLATVVSAPLLAAAGGRAEIASIVTWLAVGLVFSSVGSVQMASLQRDLAFRRKTFRDMAAVLASSGVAAVAALHGLGAWSLVLGYLSRTFTSTLVLWLWSSFRPRPELHPGIARELLSYGTQVSLGSLVGFLMVNVDYFIVGNVLGAADLGVYTMAFVMATFPSTVIGEIAAATTFPGLSRLRDDRARLHQLILDAFNIAALLSIPMGLGLYLCAPALIPYILSRKWSGVIEPLQILVAFGVLRAIVSIFMPVYKAVGRPDLGWKLNLLRLVTLAPAILFSVKYGISAVAATHVILALPVLAVHTIALNRAADVPVKMFLRHLMPHVAASAVAVLAIVVGLRSAWLDALRHELIGSILVALMAVAVYGLVVVVLNPQLLDLARSGRKLVSVGR